MSTRRLPLLLLGLTLTLTACEKRDLNADDSAADKTRADASTDEQDEEADQDERDEEKDDTGDESADDASEDEESASDATAAEPRDEPELAGWDSCTDGAQRALRCDFADGGGAALCVSDRFLELRLARPDGGQSIHRHPAGPTPSVERCRYTSPRRTDSSYTFYETGQRLMVESHYINPRRDAADAADGGTDWSVTIAPRNAAPQTWRCADVDTDEGELARDTDAVAVRAGSGDTCDSLREPTLATVRGATHQARTTDATCGGDGAPAEFIGQAASADIGGMRFVADNADSDREKRATFTRVTLSGEADAWTEEIASCRSFFDRVRAQSDTTTLGRAPFEIDVGFGYIGYDGHRIVDMARDVCTDFCEAESAYAGDFIASDIEALSLVGPVLSYSRQTSEAAAGGPPYHGESWGAVDIRTMQPARFDALIEPASILTALEHDSYVRRHEDLSKAVSEADSLDTALDALRQKVDGVGAYSFHYYNARKNIVAMRIPFLESTAGLSPNRMSQIGLWVTPRAEWIPAFEAARNAPAGGFYMNNFDWTF